MIGQKVRSPSGFDVVMGANHHMAKPVMIGEIQADGQFEIVYKSGLMQPNPWSPYIKSNKSVTAQVGGVIRPSAGLRSAAPGRR